jgi:hypothetical protein
MPYEISLDRDLERGLDRYTIAIDEDFDSVAANELGDWVTAAAQNPTAVFEIDVTRAPTRAGRAVNTLLARCAWLRARRRVDVVKDQFAGHGVALLALAPLASLV